MTPPQPATAPCLSTDADDPRLQALVRAASDVIFRMSADWSQMHELEGREFIASTSETSTDWVEKYVYPEDRALVLGHVAAAVKSGGMFELEHRVIRADGTPGWTFSRAAPAFGANGQITEWIGIARDVTARKQDEQKLAQQRRLYEAILTNTPDLAYVWDLQHRFIYANEGLLAMWGKTWDEAIGRTCLQLGYEPWHAQMHDREIEQVIATGLPLRGEVPFNGAFGRRIYDYLLVPVFGLNGDVEAVAGTTRDVTDRKQMEASLLESDRRKDEFLATLAHELRNPLAPIRNAVQLLKHVDSQDTKLSHARDIIDRQMQHMIRLVDDLLEVSRITLGQVTLRSQPTSLRRVLEDALEVSGPSIQSRNHQLVLELPPPDLQVVGDSTRLSQVFQNLLDNAAKYTPAGGRISLGARQTGEHVTVTIRDSGIGIEPEFQPRIFNLFTRVDSDAIKTTGLGIGLALAKQFVGLHGGSIAVTSAGRELGSEFAVTLPLPPQTAAPGGQHAGAMAAEQELIHRVLVVDDNQDAATSLGMLLEMYGCTVAVAFDGAKAIAAAATFKPDIALLDIGMPGMDGHEVARRLRADPGTSAIRLVALTGWGQDKDKQLSAEAGFDLHLTKPVEPDAIIALLNESKAR
ncbi:MAG: ATP-binding protein [Steroidobacteraceae bacterium]